MAIESISADARDLKANLAELGQEIRDTKNSIAGLLNNPLDAAVHKLLIPAVVTIVSGLRSKKDEA